MYNNPWQMKHLRVASSPAHLSRAVRRALAVTSVLAVIGGVVVYELGRRAGARDIGFSAGAVLLVLGVMAALIVWRWSRNRGQWADDGLDERDRRVRDRAWATSYRVLAMAVLGAILAINVLGLMGADIAAEIAREISMMMIAFVAILPTLVLAWTEPDLPADGE